MALLLTGGPLGEPVSLNEAKAHMRVDSADEDMLISGLITSARIYIETSTAQVLLTQNWSYFLDGWPSDNIVRLPLSPVQSITSVKVYDAGDVAATVSPGDYYTDTISGPARIIMRAGQAWPVPGRPLNGIEIGFSAGYGTLDSDVPATLRQAMLLLVAHWYEHREPVLLDGRAVKVPHSVAALLGAHRRLSL